MSRALTRQDKVSEGEYSLLFSVITDYVYALVALTLMIAESRTEEKVVMEKVVVNLINKDNQ